MISKKILIIIILSVTFGTGFLVNGLSHGIAEKDEVSLQVNDETSDIISIENKENEMENTDLKLGAFSVSLSVKDLKASKAFYEKLGFKAMGGSMEMNYLIMKNESTLIGLFQGMFEENILTFNPGWDENAQNLETFDDVRVIQKQLKDQGLSLMTEAPDSTEGPASFMVADPDGNVILVDQHR